MLKANISDFIETVKQPLNKELEFIKNNDWTTAQGIKRREAEHTLHATITDRAVKAAKDLHKLAIKDLKHPEVRSVMSTIKSIYDIYESRYYEYTDREDWTKYLEQGRDVEEVEAEMKFQSDVRNQLNSMKRTMRDINFGEEDNSVEIKMLNDAPIPLLMREVFEEAYPEVVKTKEDEKPKDKTPTKTTRGRKKNTSVSKRPKRS